MRTIFHTISIVSLLFFLFFYACQGDEAKQLPEEKKAVSVSASKVKSMDVPHFIAQTGTLLPDESVIVKSEAKGRIREICFEEGRKVREGTLLVKLDDAKIRAQIKRLNAQIEQHKIELALTEKTLERKKNLLRNDVISDQEFDDLTAQKAIGRSLIAQSEASLIEAQENLDDTRIRAPLDGITSERLVSEGDYMAVGDPVVTVVRINPLKVSVRIFEKFKKKIHRGMPVNITVDAFPGEVFNGKVYFISPEVDTKTRTFLVKAMVPNSGFRLNPGMFANISIEQERDGKALVVPWEAIVQLEDRAFLFTIEKKKARQVPVEVVKIFDDMAEVKGSLEPGQQVVIDGKFTVDDGDTVRILNMH